MNDTIVQEEQLRKDVKFLQAQLREIGEQKEREMTELDEHIAQLKDQLQETKQRVALEGKYIKKEAGVRVSVVQKRYKQQATALADEAKRLAAVLKEEVVCHEHLVAHLERNHAKLELQHEEWRQRFEDDNAYKQEELDTLKLDRARDLTALQELTERYTEYEKICEGDRRRREKQRKAAQEAVLELVATIKLQAWWCVLHPPHAAGLCIHRRVGQARHVGSPQARPLQVRQEGQGREKGAPRWQAAIRFPAHRRGAIPRERRRSDSGLGVTRCNRAHDPGSAGGLATDLPHTQWCGDRLRWPPRRLLSSLQAERLPQLRQLLLQLELQRVVVRLAVLVPPL